MRNLFVAPSSSQEYASFLLRTQAASTQEQNSVLCAWCLSEAGILPTSGSHGICHTHADKVLAEHRERRARGQR